MLFLSMDSAAFFFIKFDIYFPDLKVRLRIQFYLCVKKHSEEYRVFWAHTLLHSPLSVLISKNDSCKKESHLEKNAINKEIVY